MLLEELKTICTDLGLGDIQLREFQVEFFSQAVAGASGFLRVRYFVKVLDEKMHSIFISTFVLIRHVFIERKTVCLNIITNSGLSRSHLSANF